MNTKSFTRARIQQLLKEIRIIRKVIFYIRSGKLPREGLCSLFRHADIHLHYGSCDLRQDYFRHAFFAFQSSKNSKIVYALKKSKLKDIGPLHPYKPFPYIWGQNETGQYARRMFCEGVVEEKIKEIDFLYPTLPWYTKLQIKFLKKFGKFSILPYL